MQNNVLAVRSLNHFKKEAKSYAVIQNNDRSCNC